MGTTLLPASIESLATASYSLFDEVGGYTDHVLTARAATQPLSASTPQSKPQPRQPTAPNRYSTPAARWAALTTRDPAASKAFIYAVRTTKIYCRPDCRARLARRANVAFYDSAQLARQDGYRPCKRCKPDPIVPNIRAAPTPSTADVNGSDPSIVAQISEVIREEATDPEDVRTKIQHAVRIVRESALQGPKLSLSQLSKEVGLSKWHLHRVFKRLQGVTPREMAENLRRRSHSGSGVNSAPVDENLPVLEDDSGWMDFQLDGHEGDAGDVPLSLSYAPGPPPLTPMLSTPSTDQALTPMPWGDDMAYDPVLFTLDGIKDQHVDMDGLLSDLFPELYGPCDLDIGGWVG
ncbi:uncharacterized protein A1O9_09507 [Exophiala aquamarina CBS 119918]|uniref:HTH araC/xylS-type domain-containing protein n=1 Tax=Exophiala aquamarina CBS 119918 TaxID=1182545 RepID=A0A072P3E0_9EURO|nr:uncharacterized protein A1O9_09507 [Exophiala aquamarina CBS 119918]KEF54341.1 hypothetical protein A1O9_09507 [Exophiala aquamarina CBS 119918]